MSRTADGESFLRQLKVSMAASVHYVPLAITRQKKVFETAMNAPVVGLVDRGRNHQNHAMQANTARTNLRDATTAQQVSIKTRLNK